MISVRTKEALAREGQRRAARNPGLGEGATQLVGTSSDKGHSQSSAASDVSWRSKR
jgi:hypothetical protein